MHYIVLCVSARIRFRVAEGANGVLFVCSLQTTLHCNLTGLLFTLQNRPLHHSLHQQKPTSLHAW